LVLALQFLEQQKSSRQQAQGNIYSIGHSVNRLFMDNQDLRDYFYNNLPLPDDSDIVSKFNNTAETVADHFEFIVEISDTLNSETRKRWFNYMRAMYSNQAFSEFINSNDSFFSSKLIMILKDKSIG
jgi:hypothetical protein